MKPFILKQHDKDFSAMRVLRDEEMEQVYGGLTSNRMLLDHKLNTVTVTPRGDGGDDGSDEG